MNNNVVFPKPVYKKTNIKNLQYFKCLSYKNLQDKSNTNSFYTSYIEFLAKNVAIKKKEYFPNAKQKLSEFSSTFKDKFNAVTQLIKKSGENVVENFRQRLFNKQAEKTEQTTTTNENINKSVSSTQQGESTNEKTETTKTQDIDTKVNVSTETNTNPETNTATETDTNSETNTATEENNGTEIKTETINENDADTETDKNIKENKIENKPKINKENKSFNPTITEETSKKTNKNIKSFDPSNVRNKKLSNKNNSIDPSNKETESKNNMPSTFLGKIKRTYNTVKEKLRSVIKSPLKNQVEETKTTTNDDNSTAMEAKTDVASNKKDTFTNKVTQFFATLSIKSKMKEQSEKIKIEHSKYQRQIIRIKDNANDISPSTKKYVAVNNNSNKENGKVYFHSIKVKCNRFIYSIFKYLNEKVNGKEPEEIDYNALYGKKESRLRIDESNEL